MRNKKVILSTLILSSFFTFFSGIIRHDVDEEKYTQLASQKQFDGVGQLFKEKTFNGSCVLISERFVLTAAHVLIDYETKMETVEMNGKKIKINKPIREGVTDVSKLYILINGEKVKAKRIIIHSNYLDSLTKGSCDLALIELAEPLTKVYPISLNTSFDELMSVVIGAGYGVTGIADQPESVKRKYKKIAGENVVDSIGGDEVDGLRTILICDFDHPTRTDCNKMGSATPRPLEYISGGGDSGGGLFRQMNDKWELVGVCSGGNTNIEQLMKTGYYGQTMDWTRVSVFANWIKEHAK
jgi:secreted trypsin-like serine protease